jgi:hypothetical protein
VLPALGQARRHSTGAGVGVNELQPTLVVTLGSSDARRLTDELKAEVEAVWEKLLILYEGEAWRALGYKSWGAYFEAEFGQSRRRGYQLLEAGRVLVPVKNCSLTPANEAQARELAPLLDELGEEALVQVWDGLVDEHGLEITAKLVRRAVQAKLKPEVSRAPAPPEVPPPVEVDPARPSEADALRGLRQGLVADLRLAGGSPGRRPGGGLPTGRPPWLAGTSDAEGTQRMIPPIALERGERAFVAVLRRRYPDAAFVLRNGSIRPEDADVPGEGGAGATGDLDAVEEAAQDFSTLERVEVVPEIGEGSSNRNPGQAGG